MEEKESTALNSEDNLKKYIAKRRGEVLYLENSISFCDLIDLYKNGGYRIESDYMLENIANNPRAEEIRDDAFYVIHNHELNSEKFSRVKNALEIDAALNRIKESVLFLSNNETRKSLESQLLKVREIISNYEKYINGENLLGIIDVVENSRLSIDDQLDALKIAACESCKRLEERKTKGDTQLVLETQHEELNMKQPELMERLPEIERTLINGEEPEIEQPESIMNRVLNYYNENKYIIENDDEETKNIRISLSMLLNYLNTSDCRDYSFENKIGIVLYILRPLLSDYKEAVELNDNELKGLIAKEALKALSVGEILSEDFEAKGQETQESPPSNTFEETMLDLLQNNILFLRDKTDTPIIQSSIGTFASSEKERIINIIKRIQAIPSDVGSKLLIDKRNKHSIYIKETSGFSVSYLRLPNDSVLILDVSRDKEAIFKDAKKIDIDYEKKIEEIIYEVGVSKDEFFKREEDKVNPKKEDKGRGDKR